MDWLIWLCIVLLAYTYVGFPILLLLLSRLRRPSRQVDRDSGLPRLTAIFSFVGVEAGGTPRAPRETVEDRISDLCGNGYPADRLEILAVADGPMSGLEELEETFRGRTGAALRLLRMGARSGKTAAQNLAVREASGDVLVFTDSDTRFAPGAIAALARPLSDPRVGCACGALRYEKAGMEGGYWLYETLMKSAESRLHSLLGANGAIYAVRRRDYAALPPWALSDLVEPIYQLLQGRKTLWVPEATAIETMTCGEDRTFDRKRRITLRALGSLGLIVPVVNFKERPVTAWLFVSHKVLRWTSWLPAGALFFLSFFFSVDALYARMAVAQLAFYLYAAGIYAALPGARLPAYVIEVLAAQLVATLEWLFGRREAVWHPTGIPLRRRP